MNKQADDDYESYGDEPAVQGGGQGDDENEDHHVTAAITICGKPLKRSY